LTEIAVTEAAATRSASAADHAVGRSALLICGMHRSGTSALSRIMNLLGFELGSGLSPAADDNLKGFWEDRAVVVLNQDIFRAIGTTWYSSELLDDQWLNQPQVAELHDRAVRLVEEHFGRYPLFAVKDPRFSRLFLFWKRVFDELGIKVSMLMAIRHPSEVAESLRLRNQLPREQAYRLWLLHTLGALEWARELGGCAVHYDALLGDPAAMIDELKHWFGLPDPPDPAQLTAAASEFLDGSLRHHRFNHRIEASQEPLLDHAVAAVYSSLRVARLVPARMMTMRLRTIPSFERLWPAQKPVEPPQAPAP
jgi:O-antigen biosynthesis protein